VSGPALTPRKMVKAVRKATVGWRYDVVSIGYPGPVVGGRPLRDPAHLGPGWVKFDFQKAFERPVKIGNDAAMQALGSYRGGAHAVPRARGGARIGADRGRRARARAGAPPVQAWKDLRGIRGSEALERLGKSKWAKNVYDVVARLRDALQADYVVLGGGNVKRLRELPPQTLLGDNQNAREGGVRLWRPLTTNEVSASMS